MNLGGIGGHLHLPDWMQSLQPEGSGRGFPSPGWSLAPAAAHQTASVVEPPAPTAAPAASATPPKGTVMTRSGRMKALPTLEELRAKLGASAEKQKRTDSAPHIGWLRAKGEVPARDVTDRFKRLNAASAAGDRTLPPDAKEYTYLEVGGLFTEHYPGYMDENDRRLKDLGLDARRVPVDTDASVETNAKVVRDAILEASKSGKKVVLMGHSKGGVDITAALALYPELKPHVRAVVAMQAPYGGSPIATDVSSCAELKPTVEKFIKAVWKGDPASLSDLAYDKRKAFVAAHPYPKDIPTVSLATSSSAPLSLTAPASQYVRSRYGEASDGLVVSKDAEIPGSSVVRLDDMDHSGPAMVGIGKYRPADVTQSLIALALTTK